MSNENDSTTPVQPGDAPNLPVEAANDAAPVVETNQQSSAADQAEPETPVHPGTDLYSRLAALEKHFGQLIVAVKRDALALKDGSEGTFETIGEEVKAIGASFASHANNLIQAGIHKADDFFHLLYPHANPATIGEVPMPVSDSVDVVSDPVSVTSHAGEEASVDDLAPAAEGTEAAPPGVSE